MKSFLGQGVASGNSGLREGRGAVSCSQSWLFSILKQVVKESNRVLPKWRTQIVCHATPSGRKNHNKLLQRLFFDGR